MDVKEINKIIKYNIGNNKKLQEVNISPITIAVEGHSGIGKTSSVIQLAKELGINFKKVNLAQMEELGDLVGYPKKEFLFTKKKDDGQIIQKWMDSSLMEYAMSVGWTPTARDRMSYAIPEWLPREENGIIMFDDWNRADQRIIQAAMEIVDRQEYISWRLPKGWTIILTSNPDDGSYIVTSLDNAQKTRFSTYELEFSIDRWAEWAEDAKLDGRCINFLMLNPELVTKDVNPRSITSYFNSLRSIEKFGSEEGLELINMLGLKSVGPEFSGMFVSFVHNKLDRLIQPKSMLESAAPYVLGAVKGTIGENAASYRADLASLLITRLVNYALRMIREKKWNKAYETRIIEILNYDFLQEDIVMSAVRKLVGTDHLKFNLLMRDPNLRKYVLQ